MSVPEGQQTSIERVRLTYPVEFGGHVEQRELRFEIAVLGDFGESKDSLPSLQDRRFIEVTVDNFDEVISYVRPHLRMTLMSTSISDSNAESREVELEFTKLADFGPEAIVEQVSHLRDVFLVRDNLANLYRLLGYALEDGLQAILHDQKHLDAVLSAIGKEDSREDPTLENLLRLAGVGPSDAESEWVRDSVLCPFLLAVRRGEIPHLPDLEAMIERRVTELDKQLSKGVTEILHAPQFQRLEAIWRGLSFLVRRTDTSRGVTVKILHLTKEELSRECKRRPHFPASDLYRRLNAEYDLFGGHPFAMLVGAYEFSHAGPDLELLEWISDVAAAVHAPFVTGADPSFINLEDFTELHRPLALSKIFDTTEYRTWRRLRQTKNANHIVLVLPRLLLRMPYRTEGQLAQRFNYQEHQLQHQDCLWGNPAFALAVCAARAFETFGWCARIEGVEGGGLLEDLPTANVEAVMRMRRSPTETDISDRRAEELRSLGFAALIHWKGTASAVFQAVPSIQYQFYEDDSAKANAMVATSLPVVLVVDRIAQYFKVIARDALGRQSLIDRQNQLQNWITQYVNPDEASTPRTPLRLATLKLRKLDDLSDRYALSGLLHPQYQVPSLTVPVRLSTTVPAAR